MWILKRKKKISWHFGLIPVSKEESERIREQINDGIPANIFVIRGNKIYCGGENAGGVSR